MKVTDGDQEFLQVDAYMPKAIVEQFIRSLPPDIANTAHFAGDQGDSRQVSYYPLTVDQVVRLSGAILRLDRPTQGNSPVQANTAYRPVGFYILIGLGIAGTLLFAAGLVLAVTARFRKRSDLIHPDRLL